MSSFVACAAIMLALAMSVVLVPLVQGHATPRRRWPVALLVIVIPALAASVYLQVGNPKALQPAQQAVAAQAAADINPEQVEQMVARLAAKLKTQPNDADGWRMLARSYETLRRFDAAADAYRHLVALQPEDPDLLVDYAVVLGMTLDHHLSGPPQALIEQALAINPNHVQALALLGSAALERGDYTSAVKPWKKILALVPADSDVARSIIDSIAKAEERAAAAR